jgi:hypothetical protein
MAADESFVPPHIKKLVEDAAKPPPKDDDDDDDKDSLEMRSLLSELKKFPEPGVWAVAVGPTTVVSMFNMSLATEHHISQQSISFATNLASGSQSYTDIGKYNINKQFEWIEGRARGADSWNRKVCDSGAFLDGAISAFNGKFSKIVHCDEKEAEGGNWPHHSARGRQERHYPTVTGWLAMGDKFEAGNTDNLNIAAWHLEEMLILVNKKAESMHVATSCWKFVTIDCRKSIARRQPGAAPKVGEKRSLADDKPSEDQPTFTDSEDDMAPNMDGSRRGKGKKPKRATKEEAAAQLASAKEFKETLTAKAKEAAPPKSFASIIGDAEVKKESEGGSSMPMALPAPIVDTMISRIEIRRA